MLTISRNVVWQFFQRPCCNPNKRDEILKHIKWVVIFLVIMTPAVLPAAFEHEHILRKNIDAPILDVTTNPAEDLVFILTPQAVLIYSTSDRSILDRIPLDASFDRIAYQNEDRLVLTAKEPSRISIIGFSRIYNIDLSGRAVKGPPDANVTLVVFDDYQ